MIDVEVMNMAYRYAIMMEDDTEFSRYMKGVTDPESVRATINLFVEFLKEKGIDTRDKMKDFVSKSLDVRYMAIHESIGRKVCSARAIAASVVSMYRDLDDEQLRFAFADIYNTVYDKLSFTINMDVPAEFREMNPFDIITKFMGENGINTNEGFTEIGCVTVTGGCGDIKDVRFTCERLGDGDERPETEYVMIDQLVPWVNLGSFFDRSDRVLLELNDGRMADCFPVYMIRCVDGGTRYEKGYAITSRFLENPYDDAFITTDMVKEIHK